MAEKKTIKKKTSTKKKVEKVEEKKLNGDATLDGLSYELKDNGDGVIRIDKDKFKVVSFVMKISSFDKLLSSINNYLGYPEGKEPWLPWSIDVKSNKLELLSENKSVETFIKDFGDKYIDKFILEDKNKWTAIVSDDAVIWTQDDKFFHSFINNETNLIYILPRWDIEILEK